MRCQNLLQARQIQRRHRVVGDDERSACFGQTLPRRGVIKQTGANGDVVTALAEVYVYVFSVRHGAAVSIGSKPASSSWVTIIVTMVGMRGRLVSMTKCAAAW